MDALIAWLRDALTGQIPPDTLGVVLTLGTIVAGIVAAVRTVWKTQVDWQVMLLVVIVSLGLNVLVFAQAGILAKVVPLILAVILTAASAVFEHQAMVKAVTPAVKVAIAAVQPQSRAP